MDEELTPEKMETMRGDHSLILEKDSEYLFSFLDREWERLRDVYRWRVIRILIKEKQCNVNKIMPFLYRLMDSPDDLYRYYAINAIAELDGRNQREILERSVNEDAEEGNRIRALFLLSEIFEKQRDRDILKSALTIYETPKSSVTARLTAGVAMMLQLGIPLKDGPAFWDDYVEELEHPKILRAVNETREILGKGLESGE